MHYLILLAKKTRPRNVVLNFTAEDHCENALCCEKNFLKKVKTLNIDIIKFTVMISCHKSDIAVKSNAKKTLFIK